MQKWVEGGCNMPLYPVAIFSKTEYNEPTMAKSNTKIRGKLRAYLQMPILMGGILLLVNVGIYLFDIKSGVLLSGFLLVYMTTVLCMLIFSRSALTADLVSFATEYGLVQKGLIKGMELPYAVLDDTGKVIWMNTAFEKLGTKEQFYKKSISSIFPELDKDELPAEGENKAVDISFDSKDYKLRIKRFELTEMRSKKNALETEENDGVLYAVYLFDHTALKLALKEVDDQSLVVGQIYIDNYEEALESVEDVGRSLLGAFIDRQVNSYFASIDGIVRKLEKDKYLVIMRKSALTKLKEGKFHILEEVKSIDIGNKTAVTLSIGIGVDGLSYAQNLEFARNAMDLALGRGGDQAVVKNRNDVLYFGGKSEQKGNLGRVKARSKAQGMQELISARDRVLVMGHRNGDADCFGAAVGVRAACQSLQKECHIVIDKVTPSLQPMVDMYLGSQKEEEEPIVNAERALELAEGNTIVVVVDVGRPSITECPELLKYCSSVIVVDHHRAASEQVENPTLSYIDPTSSSACEMLVELLQYFGGGVKIGQVVANCLYAGIVMDTQNFTSKTGARTFEAAAYLRKNAADATKIRKMFREDPADYKAKAECIRHAEVYRKDFVISFSPSEGLKSPTVVAAQAANELLNIRGVKASFVMTDYQGKIFISARSIDEVNVQRVMEHFGGGGHMNMAGAQLENSSVEAAIIEVKNTLDKMIEEEEI